MSKSIRLSKPKKVFALRVPLIASKSESNRVLLLHQLAGNTSLIYNLSTARDTVIMQQLISSTETTLNVLDAGTVMRFMTAYLALGNKDRKITGSLRMCQRPIKLLVDALIVLGADIQYLENKGYPPLLFKKFTSQKTKQLTIAGNISSQYISALLMIAPTLPDGLEIELEGELYSRPYIEMTLNLMAHFGVEGCFDNTTITITPQKYRANDYSVESDWSSASYWYSWYALADDTAQITLQGLKKSSNQGDQAIVQIMRGLGVSTSYKDGVVVLSKCNTESHLIIDFKPCPDLAPTVMVCATAKGISIEMTGLESLKIKESDRTTAMATELAKIGAKLVDTGDGKWHLTPPDFLEIDANISFNTYNDHRMAMALAPLTMLFDCEISDPKVVIKSYPEYWKHLEMAGVHCEREF